MELRIYGIMGAQIVLYAYIHMNTICFGRKNLIILFPHQHLERI